MEEERRADEKRQQEDREHEMRLFCMLINGLGLRSGADSTGFNTMYHFTPPNTQQPEGHDQFHLSGSQFNISENDS